MPRLTWQMRHEDHLRLVAPGELELLLDLRKMTVRPDRVRPEVLVHLGEELLYLGAAPAPVVPDFASMTTGASSNLARARGTRPSNAEVG